LIARHSPLDAEIAVPQLHWEDFSPGSVSEFGPRPVTRDEIVEFAAAFDPQPMHLDEAAARASMLGSLAASGWHSCCLLMRMISDGFLSQSHFLGAPGVDEVRWLKPLRAGESVIVRATVLETRASRSRPGLGFVKFQFELLDSSGALLMTLTVSPMFARRDAVNASPDGTSN
jgi:acyl dehydratase